MEQFQKNPSEILRKMKQLEELSDVTLVSGNGEIIRAHKVVLASANKIFRDMIQTEEEDM